MSDRRELALCLSGGCLARYRDRIEAVLAPHGRTLAPVAPESLPDDASAAFELAWFTRDLHIGSSLQTWSPAAARFWACCERTRTLRWLHSFSSGSDFSVIGRLMDRGVRVSTSIGAAAVPIARSAIAGLLALSRRFPRFVAARQAREWRPLAPADWPSDLDGQSLAIVGMGMVGREVARLARALGLRVIGLTRTGDALPGDCDEVHPSSALAELAPRIDWLVLACPLTPDTAGLVSATVLERLRPGAGLVNIARGGLVDEPALCAALAAGRLVGAYLDVFAAEPLPHDSPLWDLPDVLLSPHNAALSTGNEERTTRMFLANLDAWLAGRPLASAVRTRPVLTSN